MPNTTNLLMNIFISKCFCYSILDCFVDFTHVMMVDLDDRVIYALWLFHHDMCAHVANCPHNFSTSFSASQLSLHTVHCPHISTGRTLTAPCYVMDLPRMGIEVTLTQCVSCVWRGRQYVERKVAGLRSVCSLYTMCVMCI